MHYHGEVVRAVRKAQRDERHDRDERYSAGLRLLLDGTRFWDLVTAYFEVVGEFGQCVKRRERKSILMQNEKLVLGVFKKQQTFWREHHDGFSTDEAGKCQYDPFKWVWDVKNYSVVREEVGNSCMNRGTQRDVSNYEEKL